MCPSESSKRSSPQHLTEEQPLDHSESTLAFAKTNFKLEPDAQTVFTALPPTTHNLQTPVSATANFLYQTSPQPQLQQTSLQSIPFPLFQHAPVTNTNIDSQHSGNSPVHITMVPGTFPLMSGNHVVSYPILSGFHHPLMMANAAPISPLGRGTAIPIAIPITTSQQQQHHLHPSERSALSVLFDGIPNTASGRTQQDPSRSGFVTRVASHCQVGSEVPMGGSFNVGPSFPTFQNASAMSMDSNSLKDALSEYEEMSPSERTLTLSPPQESILQLLQSGPQISPMSPPELPNIRLPQTLKLHEPVASSMPTVSAAATSSNFFFCKRSQSPSEPDYSNHDMKSPTPTPPPFQPQSPIDSNSHSSSHSTSSHSHSQPTSSSRRQTLKPSRSTPPTPSSSSTSSSSTTQIKPPKSDIHPSVLVQSAQLAIDPPASKPRQRASALNPYLCPYPGCTKTYSRKSHLASHAVSHSLRRDFICEFCGVGFARAYDMRRHRKSTHGVASSASGAGRGFAKTTVKSEYSGSEEEEK
ncbi:hypothetical protein HDU97_002830 [Phlyctochytrium planicorne]|nr:hypothetical protein HDU97_002830 [Phlyctochytrium planicorne]